MSEAAGGDMEAHVLQGFSQWFKVPAYAAYMEQVLMKTGPPGSYQVTCKDCHMLPDAPNNLECKCQDARGRLRPSGQASRGHDRSQALHDVDEGEQRHPLAELHWKVDPRKGDPPDVADPRAEQV